MGTAPTLRAEAETTGGWIVEHDDRRSFILPYLFLSVTFSLFVSLFWLFVLVAIHLSFEVARARRLRLEPTLPRALWEIKLDLGLLGLALSMAVYMDVAFGILGLGAGARAGAAAARVGARADLLRRAIRAVLLVLDDIVRVVGVVVATKGIRDADVTTPDPSLPPWKAKWGLGDWLSLGLLGAVTLLLALSPWLSGHAPGEILGIVFAELHPFP